MGSIFSSGISLAFDFIKINRQFNYVGCRKPNCPDVTRFNHIVPADTSESKLTWGKWVDINAVDRVYHNGRH